MASSPITSWQIDGEKIETMADFIFLGSKITADGFCSYDIKRRLLLGRKAKAMTNLDSVLKSRDKQRGLSRQSYGFSQHQGLFQRVGSLHQMAKVLELQLQHQSLQ